MLYPGLESPGYRQGIAPRWSCHYFSRRRRATEHIPRRSRPQAAPTSPAPAAPRSAAAPLRRDRPRVPTSSNTGCAPHFGRWKYSLRDRNSRSNPCIAHPAIDSPRNRRWLLHCQYLSPTSWLKCSSPKNLSFGRQSKCSSPLAVQFSILRSILNCFAMSRNLLARISTSIWRRKIH